MVPLRLVLSAVCRASRSRTRGRSCRCRRSQSGAHCWRAFAIEQEQGISLQTETDATLFSGAARFFCRLYAARVVKRALSQAGSFFQRGDPMEPDRVTYSPLITRPKLRWPGDARVALWVVPNIEHYEYLPPVGSRDPWPRTPHPDVLGYGTRDYGNRVGLWRMFDVMDKHDIRCTISLNLAVYEHYPEIIEACEARAGT